MPLNGIADKVAIVTGGASGIGEGAVRRLSDEGAKLVVVDWNEQGAEAVAGSLPRDAIAVHADVSLEEDVERYMQTALDRFGRVDLVFLNAGISSSFALFTEVPTDNFDLTIAVNLRSVFLGLRAALRQFEAQGGGGAIVTTASLLGITAGEVLIPYIAAKHGVVGLTKAAAMHGAKNGIRANVICPGFIVTGLMAPLRESLGSDEALDALEQGIPMRRFGTPDEVGALVTYLLSDDASYVTGAVIPIDAAYSSGAMH